MEDRPTWVGPALVLTLAQAAAGSSSHLARWSGVKLFLLCLFIPVHSALPRHGLPASCRIGTSEN